MNQQLFAVAVSAALAWSGAQAANQRGPQWGPYNAEFPAASDGLLKKAVQGAIFAAPGNGGAAQPFSMAGWFKPSQPAPGRTLIAGVADPAGVTGVTGMTGAAGVTGGAGMAGVAGVPGVAGVTGAARTSGAACSFQDLSVHRLAALCTSGGPA